jgi:hypothetical protein
VRGATAAGRVGGGVGRINPNGRCVKKLSDEMGGNPLWLYQGATEPLGLSRIGRSIPVSSMPLKGTGEARGKPPRCPAWLRDRMVSSNEVDFNLRGTGPLSQDFA